MTRVPPRSPATVVVDDVRKSTPVKTVVTTFRVQLVPPFVVRQTSMSTGPVLWALPPGNFESAMTAVPFAPPESTTMPFGYR